MNKRQKKTESSTYYSHITSKKYSNQTSFIMKMDKWSVTKPANNSKGYRRTKA